MTLADAVVYYVTHNPGSTNTQITRGLFRWRYLLRSYRNKRTLSASVSSTTNRLFQRGELDRVVDVTRHQRTRPPFTYKTNSRTREVRV